MKAKPCANPDCTRLVPTGQTYCARCNAAHGKTRSARPHYAGEWDKISRDARAAHLAKFGPVCPGFEREAHVVSPADLVADHVTARSPDAVAVMCRSCNSSKARDEKAARRAGGGSST